LFKRKQQMGCLWKMVSSLFLLRHTQQFLEDLNLLSALDLACHDIAPTANH